MHPIETTTATRVTATATMTQHAHPTKAANATDAATGTVCHGMGIFFFVGSSLRLDGGHLPLRLLLRQVRVHVRAGVVGERVLLRLLRLLRLLL